MIPRTQNKKGAMQMSVGTIVTIVLLMSVLVLGIFLVQQIFSTGTNAIDQVDSEIQSQIDTLFSDKDDDLIIFPPSRQVTIEKGSDSPSGFALSISNPSNSDKNTFSYGVSTTEDNTKKCAGVSPEDVESWMLGGTGEVQLDPSQQSNPIKVFFTIPEEVPDCTFRVKVNAENTGDGPSPKQKFVVISPTSGGVF